MRGCIAGSDMRQQMIAACWVGNELDSCSRGQQPLCQHGCKCIKPGLVGAWGFVFDGDTHNVEHAVLVCLKIGEQVAPFIVLRSSVVRSPMSDCLQKSTEFVVLGWLDNRTDDGVVILTTWRSERIQINSMIGKTSWNVDLY